MKGKNKGTREGTKDQNKLSGGRAMGNIHGSASLLLLRQTMRLEKWILQEAEQKPLEATQGAATVAATEQEHKCTMPLLRDTSESPPGSWPFTSPRRQLHNSQCAEIREKLLVGTSRSFEQTAVPLQAGTQKPSTRIWSPTSRSPQVPAYAMVNIFVGSRVFPKRFRRPSTRWLDVERFHERQ